MKLQLVITPNHKTEDKFLVEVESDDQVSAIKTAVKALKDIPLDHQRLLHDGHDLDDEKKVGESGLQAFSDLTMITGPPGVPSLQPNVTEGDVETSNSNEVVSKAELQRTVVVTGIPSSEDGSERSTQDELQAYFSDGGHQVSRIILQSEADSGQQHAVIIFASVASVPHAVQLGAEKPLMGSMVNVVAAMQLNPEEQLQAENDEAADVAVEMGPRATQAQDMVAGILSSGYASGKQGMAKVRSLDAQYRVGERVGTASKMAKEKVSNFDSEYGISAKAGVALAAASAKTKELNERFKVTESVSKVADSAKATVEGVDEKYKISATASQKAKQIDERFGVTEKTQYARAAVSSFFGGIATKFSSALKSAEETGTGEVHSMPPPVAVAAEHGEINADDVDPPQVPPQ